MAITGKKIIEEIEVPTGITATVTGNTATIKGPKGELKREFKSDVIHMAHKDNKITLTCEHPRGVERTHLGTIAAHIRNMFKGVTDGFEYHLKVYYAHFPMNVAVQGDKVMIKNFLGEKHPREADIVGTTKVTIKGLDITLTGTDKEAVGQTAGNLVQATKIRHRDQRTFLDGIFVADKGEA